MGTINFEYVNEDMVLIDGQDMACIVHHCLHSHIVVQGAHPIQLIIICLHWLGAKR